MSIRARLGVFALLLIGLNTVFHTQISILGSVLLSVALSALIAAWERRG